ncbi:MAG: hypothetical protein JWN67_1944 [Actinomycetia bacterium]|nr:hypothetical protein [Actinomycetes bacterium]
MTVDPGRAPSPAGLALLQQGEAEVQGRMPWSSNGTFLTKLTEGDESMLAVYKPGQGERPLWDFPRGLYRREAAAWELSELLGWGIVPETIVRDGPFGEGSMQRFVNADFEEHYFTIYEDEAHHPVLKQFAVFDLLANNTDRKSGHVLLGDDGRLWGIDQGLCFHPDPKIRTVIWEFGGERIPDELLDAVRDVLPKVDVLEVLLDDEERDAVRSRGERLLKVKTFPLADPSGRCYPWPMV